MKKLVIGLGNEYRRDDAIGLLIARDLRKKDLPEVEIVESSGEITELMDCWGNADYVFAVDALDAGGAPGTLHCFNAQQGPLPTESFSCSTHAISLPEAIELARALDQLPPHLQVYGIQGKDFSAGDELSVELQSQRKTLTEKIIKEISQGEQENA
ncbi:MAG: hydrogenase maturation protease [bacterium]|nr:hydrogenase maturation protease [bacterium]